MDVNINPDLVQFNVPCAPFLIMVSPVLKEDNERYGEMLYHTITYLKAYTSGMSFIADPAYMIIEFYGNSYFLHNDLGECLMFSELEGEYQEDAQIMSVKVMPSLVIIEDRDFIYRKYMEE